jgi:excisionase family DNA binding protein
MKAVRVDRITLLTKEELAALLKVSPWTIHSYLRKGQMPKPFPLVAGGELRWRASDIEAWLDDLQRKPPKAPLRGALAKLGRL